MSLPAGVLPEIPAILTPATSHIARITKQFFIHEGVNMSSKSARKSRKAQKSPAQPAKKSRKKPQEPRESAQAEAVPVQAAPIPPQDAEITRVVVDFMTAEGVEILREKNGATFEPREWATWPREPRRLLFEVLRDTGGKLRIGEQTFDDPFKGVLVAIVASDSVAARERMVELAVDAAAVFHGGIPELPAQAIVRRMSEVGITPPTAKTIAKMIRQAAGSADNTEKPEIETVQAAAERYVAWLMERENIAPPFKPLILHRGIFFERESTKWRRLTDTEMEIRVTRFLQRGEGAPSIPSVVAGVMSNLRGLVYAPAFDEHELPFHVADWTNSIVDDTSYIEFSNGLLPVANVEAGTNDAWSSLQDHDPSWVSESVLPFAYDSEATCPRWLQYLGEVLPMAGEGDNRQLVLQEFFGYLLLSTVIFHVWLALTGNGETGKSVAAKIAAELVGRQNCSALPLGSIFDRFAMNELVGKRANIYHESERVDKIDEGKLKALIAGDTMTAEAKYQRPYSFRWRGKLLIAANNLPTFSDASDGMWRRLIRIPFENVVPPERRNRRLSDELKSELPGIVNWALAGARRLIMQNRFTYCAKCEESKSQHRVESDTVRAFHDEYCFRQSCTFSATSKLYEIYKYDTRKKGRMPVSETEFGRRLTSMGYRQSRIRQNASDRPGTYRIYGYAEIAVNAEGQELVKEYCQRNEIRQHEFQVTFIRRNNRTEAGATEPESDPGGPGTVRVESGGPGPSVTE